MERMQGLHRTTDGDGLGVRSSPIQHDFFPYKNLERKASCNHSDGETSSLPVPHTIAHPSWSADWRDSWKWDGFRLRAEPVVNTHDSDGSGTHQDAQFPHNTRTYAVPDDRTSLELGLMNNLSPENNNNDDLLALTLGGTDYGLDDQTAPNAKKGRHSPPEMHLPQCQVDGCNANLRNAKDYHRRHKVCEGHSKSSKALVSQVLQRFCQQCSRFHLLEEFDGDRRSCRRRLAGHNRRRRRGQPDAAATLASVLGDDPEAFSRLINPLQQLQGKEQLKQLLQVLGQTLKSIPAGEDTPTTSLCQRSSNDVLNVIRSGTQISEASSSAVGGASSDELLNTVLKSQLLRNLFLSNSTIANNLLAVASAAPANVQISHISALYDALLSSGLALQPKTDENFCQQGGDSTLNVREQSERHFNMSDAHVTIDHCSNIPSKEFNVSNDNLNDSIHFGRNSVHVTSSEHMKVGKAVQNWKQGLTAIHDEPFKAKRAFEALKGTCTNGNASTNTFLMAERFAGGLEKQEQTFQLWFKMFDKSPADLPPTLREQMLEWLHHLPTEMEGYIRPGCVILTVFVCMSVYAWEELCNNIEENLYRLLSSQEGHFWCKGQTLVHFGEASAFIIEGKVVLNNSGSLVNSPWLILVQPFAVVVGEKVDLILKGHNLEEPGTKFICSYEGNCIEKELDLRTEEDEERGLRHAIPEKQENLITFHVGPFDNMGHSFIEVEGHNTKGNTFPIIIADKPLCKEILSLEAEFTNILENCTYSGLQIKEEQSDIVHFIYELGWLLHRIQWNALYAELRTQRFSPGKYRWLLQFSVKHGFCIVVKRILDFIFSQDNDAWNNTYERTYEMLSEISLLHLAVSSKSRAMVETLLEYIPPRSSDFKQKHIFRPDVRSHSGLTPLHIAASLRGAISLMDALTNAPEESWVEAWLSSKDSLDQTPLMYALATGNHECIQLVQKKIDQTDLKPSHLSLDIDSSLQKMPARKQMRHCSCKEREVMLGPNFSLKAQRPFVLSMLAIAAMCVCVGLLMKGPPTISFIQGPFVWKFIKFGPI